MAGCRRTEGRYAGRQKLPGAPAPPLSVIKQENTSSKRIYLPGHSFFLCHDRKTEFYTLATGAYF